MLSAAVCEKWEEEQWVKCNQSGEADRTGYFCWMVPFPYSIILLFLGVMFVIIAKKL